MEIRVIGAPSDRSQVWYLEFQHEGKRRRISSGLTLKREARERAGDIVGGWIANQAPAAPLPGERLMLADFWPKYEVSAKAEVRASTLAQNKRAWAAFVKAHPGCAMDDITFPVAETYRNKLAETMAPATVNTVINRLKAVYTFAIDPKRKLLPPGAVSPFKGLKKIALPDAPPRGLESDELDSLLREAKRQGWNTYIYVALGALAGLRKREACETRWSWIDFDNDLLHVKCGNGFTTKSGKGRSLPLHSRLRDILTEYKVLLGVADGADGYLLAPEKTERGKWLYRYEGGKGLAAAAKRAGLADEFSYHALRHTFGFLLGDSGVSPAKIMLWMGHADIGTTMIYVKLKPKYDTEIEKIV